MSVKLHFGKLVKDDSGKVIQYQPGLHVMIPIVNTIKTFDTRLQTLDVEAPQVFTVKQKPMMIDYYAQWKIVDLGKYYRTTGGNSSNATRILTQQINDALRAAIGKRTLKAVVTSDRESLMQMLSGIAEQSVNILGIKVMDVRLKRIELPDAVQNRIYLAMKMKRKKLSRFYRFNGGAEKTKIEAQADAAYIKTISTANVTAQNTRAQGDHLAADIYQKAYQKNVAFYEFYRGLEAYRGVFRDKNTIMVLKPSDNRFFQFFTHSMGGASKRAS
jgi:Membrane protease subunits, stomatin/prohibitin homologs